jgi:hypothetical protein
MNRLPHTGLYIAGILTGFIMGTLIGPEISLGRLCHTICECGVAP